MCGHWGATVGHWCAVFSFSGPDGQCLVPPQARSGWWTQSGAWGKHGPSPVVQGRELGLVAWEEVMTQPEPSPMEKRGCSPVLTWWVGGMEVCPGPDGGRGCGLSPDQLLRGRGMANPAGGRGRDLAPTCSNLPRWREGRMAIMGAEERKEVWAIPEPAAQGGECGPAQIWLCAGAGEGVPWLRPTMWGLGFW